MQNSLFSESEKNKNTGKLGRYKLMEIKTKSGYQKALKKRAELLEAYSFLSTASADSLDKQISEVDAQIERYEAQGT